MVLELTNPHSVLAALEHRPRDVLEVVLATGKPSDAWRRAADAAMDRGVPVSEAAPVEADARGRGREPVRSKSGGGRRRGGPDRRERGRDGAGRRPDGDRAGGGRRGVAHARVRPLEGLEPEELFGGVRDPGRGHGLWLALDCVQDPHNLGAVFRSAAFFGVRGVLLTRDRSAPLSAVAYDVASGGLECVPFSMPANLDRALKTAREAGLWILGAAEEAERDVDEVPLDRPWLLVLGNEESGLRRLTRDNCDDLCRITARGEVRSLNVSAAGAVLLSTLTRREAGA